MTESRQDPINSQHIRISRLFSTFAFMGVIALSGCGGGGLSIGEEQEKDPVVIDQPIAYIKRTIIELEEDEDPEPQNLFEPANFNPGAELYLRDQASPSSEEMNITAGQFEEGELYDIKDLEASYDGRQLLFAMRAPEIENADEEDQPKWNIWEYDLDTSTLRRIISSDIQSEAGHDVSPYYLPDGRIVFSSTRQRQTRATLLDENKPQYSALEENLNTEAFVLHVMDSDGTNIKQISYNQSHDLDPSVMDDGRILFSRWDNIANINSVNLYTINPDGTELNFLYGHHSQDTGTNNTTARFTQPRQIVDGRIMALLRRDNTLTFDAEPIIIDTERFHEFDETIDGEDTTDTAHSDIGLSDLRIDGESTDAGHLSQLYPFYDASNRFLTSWSLCRVELTQEDGSVEIEACNETNIDADNAAQADPLYSLWLLDNDNNTQLPLSDAEENIRYDEIIALESRTAPDYIGDKQPGVELDEDLVDNDIGVLHIRSIYDFDGSDITGALDTLKDPGLVTADQRPARFLRIEKAVAIPDDDVLDIQGSWFGRSGAQLMRDIIGYTPIQPDGSVKTTVPANVPLMISVVDANGRRIFGRHQNWLQFRPGEERECNGCHTGASTRPHGRPDAEAPSINSGATTTGLPFPNTEPALFADMGETMAETLARINGLPSPTADVLFTDEWTDPSVRAKDPDITYSYNNLTTDKPTSDACVGQWNSLCRITINYPTHIHPMWEVDRGADTCINCHNTRDELDNVQVPAAQLDLTSTLSPDNADHLVSYRELLFGDTELELDMGALIERRVQDTDANGDPLFETDEDGELILDANEDPIPVLIPVPVSAVMSTAGALASPNFLDRFATGGSHENRLTPDELRLISEWLDIGAQYYNNPFDAPL